MSHHQITFDKLSASTPLANLINQYLEEPELKKSKLLGHFIDDFHLKYTVTLNVDGRHVSVNGRDVVNFGSVNYLGLEQHPRVISASIEGLNKWGNHSGCSRVFSSHDNIIKLEKAVADLVGADKALICPNTAQTHLAVIPTLFSSSDCHIFIDRHAHTSMYQASLTAKAKGAKTDRVDTSEMELLERSLTDSKSKTKVLLVDGLYSMQGYLPDIKRLHEICEDTNTILYIDDAHGVGIYGENGGGICEHFNLGYNNVILTGTLQKALGCFGGFVAGSSPLIDVLRVSSKAYIFSGTIQPHAVEGALAAIEICKSEEGKELRKDLFKKSAHIRERLTKMGFSLEKGDSPIIPVLSGGDIKTLLAGRFLFDEGIFLNSVLFPAVPKGEGILRISVTTLHSDEDCERLLMAFEKLKTYWASWAGFNFKNLQYLEEILKAQARKVLTLGTEKTV